MQINQDDQDDDETSSKKTKGKSQRATSIHSYKFHPYLPGVSMYTLSGLKPLVQDNDICGSFVFARTSIRIAICCLRI